MGREGFSSLYILNVFDNGCPSEAADNADNVAAKSKSFNTSIVHQMICSVKLRQTAVYSDELESNPYDVVM